jgi:hypothetical protein
MEAALALISNGLILEASRKLEVETIKNKIERTAVFFNNGKSP